MAVARGVALEWRDALNQTPMFYCAKAGNIPLGQYLISLGMSVHFRDLQRRTALFIAVAKQKWCMAEFLIEAGASPDIKDSYGHTPLDLVTSPKMLRRLQDLKLQQREQREMELKQLGKVEAASRKRKRNSAVVGDQVCTWSKARSRMVAWMNGREPPEDRALTIDKDTTEVICENDDYFTCKPPVRAAKRLRRSERQFVFDHSELCRHLDWYSGYKPDDWCKFLGVLLNQDRHHVSVIEKAAAGVDTSFTLTAVEKSTNLVAGYVHAKRSAKDSKDLRLNHVKVDHGHQGKRLGGLLIRSAEKHSSELGWGCDTTSLIVMSRNKNARKCYAKDNFEMTSCTPGKYPSDAKPTDREHWCSMARQHSFTKHSPY
mmetsp:Transcript_32033/g.72023  ORF Transcript_32033/g.72023 Transcript_32033/m.72023 type:complete len:373 (+) Transcript_32033:135-1253(+)